MTKKEAKQNVLTHARMQRGGNMSKIWQMNKVINNSSVLCEALHWQWSKMCIIKSHANESEQNEHKKGEKKIKCIARLKDILQLYPNRTSTLMCHY